MPTQNWLTAAGVTPDEAIFIMRVPFAKLYLASKPGHYPVTGEGSPYHTGLADSGLPDIKRKIDGMYDGPVVMTVASAVTVDRGDFDTGFGDYSGTLQGRLVEGYVTFPSLSNFADAHKYLSARIDTVEINNKGEMVFTLIDAAMEKLHSAISTGGSFTSAKLGDVVKARLIAAGIDWATEVDTSAWDIWYADAGQYVVTGNWIEGAAYEIIRQLLGNTLSVWGFDRDTGKFYIYRFTDLPATPPSVDIDLTDALIGEKYSMAIYRERARKISIKYAAGGSTVTKTINVPTTDDRWLGGWDYDFDIGLDNLADASDLALKWLTLLKAQHAVAQIQTDKTPLGYNVGAVGKMDFAKWNLPAGLPQYSQVIAANDNEDDGTVGLKLWIKTGDGPGVAP